MLSPGQFQAIVDGFYHYFSRKSRKGGQVSLIDVRYVVSEYLYHHPGADIVQCNGDHCMEMIESRLDTILPERLQQLRELVTGMLGLTHDEIEYREALNLIDRCTVETQLGYTDLLVRFQEEHSADNPLGFFSDLLIPK